MGAHGISLIIFEEILIKSVIARCYEHKPIKNVFADKLLDAGIYMATWATF